MSRFLSNQQLCKFAGWKPGSGQFEVYVHLTNEDVNGAIRKHFNLDHPSAEEKVPCPTCGQTNTKGAIECLRCKRPLSLESATRKQKLQDVLELLGRLQESGKLDALLGAFVPPR